MHSDWLTREEDLHLAREFIAQYAKVKSVQNLGLFETVVDLIAKRMDFCLSEWVVMLARQYMAQYGAEHGDFVTRQVIGLCLRQGEVAH